MDLFESFKLTCRSDTREVVVIMGELSAGHEYPSMADILQKDLSNQADLEEYNTIKWYNVRRFHADLTNIHSTKQRTTQATSVGWIVLDLNWPTSSQSTNKQTNS